MAKSAILIGVGEIGGVFAKGLLKNDYIVAPVNRGQSITNTISQVPSCSLIINTVGEKDLDETLGSLINQSDHLVLVQNELLPSQWENFDIEPTVISIWFEKKLGNEPKEIIPSPVFGSKSQVVSEILSSVGLNTRILKNKNDLLFELVLKNTYILTTNLCGLVTKGNVADLKKNHHQFMLDIFSEVVLLQEALTNKKFDKDKLLEAMLAAFDGDLAHMCMGRSAPDRLSRALTSAKKFGIVLPAISQLDVSK